MRLALVVARPARAFQILEDGSGTVSAAAALLPRTGLYAERRMLVEMAAAGDVRGWAAASGAGVSRTTAAGGLDGRRSRQPRRQARLMSQERRRHPDP